MEKSIAIITTKNGGYIEFITSYKQAKAALNAEKKAVTASKSSGEYGDGQTVITATDMVGCLIFDSNYKLINKYMED